MTLQPLFRKGVKASIRTRHAQEEEEVYMRVMAELDEQDDTLGDGEFEIDDEVWGAQILRRFLSYSPLKLFPFLALRPGLRPKA